MTVEQLTILRAEIIADPLAVGYRLMRNGDIATALNDRRHPLLSGIVNRRATCASDIRARISFVDFASLKSEEQEWVRGLLQGDCELDVTEELKGTLAYRQMDGGIWPDTVETAPEHIREILEFRGSRAEVLLGEGVVIHSCHATDAGKLKT